MSYPFHFLVKSLISAGVQMLPVVSSLTPFTTLIPLLAVLLLSVFKDACDDYVSVHGVYCCNKKRCPLRLCSLILMLLSYALSLCFVNEQMWFQIWTLKYIKISMFSFLVYCQVSLHHVCMLALFYSYFI